MREKLIEESERLERILIEDLIRLLSRRREHPRRIFAMAFPAGKQIGFVYVDSTSNPGALVPDTNAANMSASNSAGPVAVSTMPTTADNSVTDANGNVIDIPVGTVIFTIPVDAASDTVNVTADVTNLAGNVEPGVALSIVTVATVVGTGVSGAAFVVNE